MAKARTIANLDPGAPVLQSAATIIATRLNEMLQYEPHIGDPANITELHQMRIASKRLRYTLEIFEPLYRARPDLAPKFTTNLETVKQIQEQLGEIHDADVLAPQIAEHAHRVLKIGLDHKRGEEVVGVHFVDFDGLQGMVSVCRSIRSERDAAYERFLVEWGRLKETAFFDDLRAMLHAGAAGPEGERLPVDPLLATTGGGV